MQYPIAYLLFIWARKNFRYRNPTPPQTAADGGLANSNRIPRIYMWFRFNNSTADRHLVCTSIEGAHFEANHTIKVITRGRGQVGGNTESIQLCIEVIDHHISQWAPQKHGNEYIDDYIVSLDLLWWLERWFWQYVIEETDCVQFWVSLEEVMHMR